MHISAGKWAARVDEWTTIGTSSPDIGNWYENISASAGATYSAPFDSSTWGAAHFVPYVANGHVRFEFNNLYADPHVLGGECCAKTTTTLSFGGKTIATTHNTDYGGTTADLFDAKMPGKGWYTMNLATTRYYPGITYPTGMLSKSSTTNFRFYGNPTTAGAVQVNIPRFVPAALDLNNQAKLGSVTDVRIGLDRGGDGPGIVVRPAPVTKLQVWASYDQGATWSPVSLTYTNSVWEAHVTNPASGTVSLRSTATNGSGITTETVINAYGVS